MELVHNENNSTDIHIAVVGCAHGELDLIYKTILVEEREKKCKIDLLICCGDFECARNDNDLLFVEGPVKFRGHKDFYKYYNMERQAPILTLFIGGNHEAVNFLQELYFGGWVAPNIYYLGHSGVVNFGDLRIAGFSGIYSAEDYQKGHYESIPLTVKEKISAFHVRQFELWKLVNLEQKVDIILSHDWPHGVVNDSNCEALYAQKPSLRGAQFGSDSYLSLLQKLRPAWWFSGHMHVNFSSVVEHKQPAKKQQEATTVEEENANCTRFHAGDKAIEGRHFVDFFSFKNTSEKVLRYDAEWLAIQRHTLQYYNKSASKVALPCPKIPKTEKDEALAWINQHNADLSIDGNAFFQSAEPIKPKKSIQQKNHSNSHEKKTDQSVLFLQRIGCQDLWKEVIK